MYIMRIWNTFFDYVIVLPEFEPIMRGNMQFRNQILKKIDFLFP